MNFLYMGLTTNFERKLFFAFGRYLWNTIGVTGFCALLVGSILYLESFSSTKLKSKKEYFGNSYATTLKSKQEYFGNKYVDSNMALLDARRTLENSGKLLDYSKWIKEMKNKEDGYWGYFRFGMSNLSDPDSSKDYVEQHDDYKKKKYLEYQNKIYSQNLPTELIRTITNQNKTYQNYKNGFSQTKENQQQIYQNYKNKVSQKNSLKSLRRAISLVPIQWGFGALLLSSVISTIFSIERNTRKSDT